MTATDDLPESWRSVLGELDLEAQPTDPPDGYGGDERTWFELYSKFATRGFVRALAGIGDGAQTLRLQFAVPASGDGSSVLSDVRDESADLTGGDWEVVAEDPDWNLQGELGERLEPSALREWLERVRELADVAASGDRSDAAWLEDGTGTDSREPASPESTDAPTESAPDSPSESVFEPIGDGAGGRSAASGTLKDVGLENWELLEADGGVEARLWLSATLGPADAEQLGRALTHALRSRYDISARPLAADRTDSPGSELRLRAEPSDAAIAGPRDPEQLQVDLESYFERLARFEELGVKLASVLGIAGETSGAGGAPSSSGRSEASKRGRGRREESGRSAERDRPPKTDDAEDRSSRRRTPSEDDSRASGREGSEEGDDEEVVLDLGNVSDETAAPSSTASPKSGLEPGNYRDPRLMRDDAETSLVDIVLRHPGYAEEKMGHNLSILLDVDFPDAMDLVQQAPSIIAWGVGRERALDFKRFIEDAGGKVVLVEPDSLTD